MNLPAAPKRSTLADLYLHTQPALDEALKSLIDQHGPTAVRQSLRRLTKGTRGRRPEQDWAELSDALQEDALDWLDGKDPLTLRSNYSIASQLAQRKPGHNQASTHRRIMGKLAKSRKAMFLHRAWIHAELGYPYTTCFKVIEEILRTNSRYAQDFVWILDRRRGMLERYRDSFGEPPLDMTMKQIEKAIEKAIMEEIGTPTRP